MLSPMCIHRPKLPASFGMFSGHETACHRIGRKRVVLQWLISTITGFESPCVVVTSSSSVGETEKKLPLVLKGAVKATVPLPSVGFVTE
jgi:hypothetical protein